MRHNPLTPIKSTDIEAMGYSEDDETLDVQFRSGKIWRYHQVGSLVGNSCMEAMSPSAYFKKFIKPHYRATPVD